MAGCGCGKQWYSGFQAWQCGTSPGKVLAEDIDLADVRARPAAVEHGVAFIPRALPNARCWGWRARPHASATPCVHIAVTALLCEYWCWNLYRIIIRGSFEYICEHSWTLESPEVHALGHASNCPS